MTWIVAAFIGATAAAGIYLLILELLPTEPSPSHAIARMSGTDRPTIIRAPSTDTKDRVGGWLETRIPEHYLLRITPSAADLELIGGSRTSLLGEKALAMVLGLFALPVLALVLSPLGLPLTLPAALTLAFVVAGFVLPDLEAKAKAKAARADFARAVTAYLELIAIERISGSGATQSIKDAARVTDSWPFQRITYALDHAQNAGHPAWQGLADLAEDIQVDELRDVANIMRSAASENAAVYAQLRARARSLRSSQLAREQESAAGATVVFTFPVFVLAGIFCAMLLYPMLQLL
ncbi:type II secretion system F family protein [Promicromonospora sp. NFX87]|uniref:type II secretion system F family protein n=1 Tax=Promicromonospora sp. NFX87 TaxID=3402691 RepID=UPI003AFB7E57